ncbi:MAG: TlpA family protein disulfide reductase [Flavipsychrobacter sp.]
MRKLTLLVFILFCGIGAPAQNIASYKAEDLTKRIKSNNDTFYVVNFWATWCAPCVKELPEFSALQKHYKNKPVKVILVSLDFPDAYPKKIEKFINKKKLDLEVVWLNETNANKFIPKIEQSWQGSIPATLLKYPKNRYKKFFEGVITKKQLQILIDKQLAMQ